MRGYGIGDYCEEGCCCGDCGVGGCGVSCGVADCGIEGRMVMDTIRCCC